MLIGYWLIYDWSVYVLYYKGFDEFDLVVKSILRNMNALWSGINQYYLLKMIFGMVEFRDKLYNMNNSNHPKWAHNQPTAWCGSYTRNVPLKNHIQSKLVQGRQGVQRSAHMPTLVISEYSHTMGSSLQ